MNLSDIEIGTQVLVTHSYDGNDNIINVPGKVIQISFGTKEIAIEFEKDVDGHTCGERGKDNYCWWISYKHLAYVFPFTIYTKEEKIANKIKYLWNKSNYAKQYNVQY